LLSIWIQTLWLAKPESMTHKSALIKASNSILLFVVHCSQPDKAISEDTHNATFFFISTHRHHGHGFPILLQSVYMINIFAIVR
jgi:hypothetical protein